jgi:hypothetical protein
MTEPSYTSLLSWFGFMDQVATRHNFRKNYSTTKVFCKEPPCPLLSIPLLSKATIIVVVS